MTLNEVMKETADAIREKTGKSELIKPIDFAEEIRGITAGGGDAPSGGWELTYYKIVEANEEMVRGLFLYGGSLIVNCAIKDAKSVTANMGVVIGYAKIENGEYEDILAIVSAKLPLQYGDEYKPATLKEVFVDAGIWDAVSPMLLEITETEYYNLE